MWENKSLCVLTVVVAEQVLLVLKRCRWGTVVEERIAGAPGVVDMFVVELVAVDIVVVVGHLPPSRHPFSRGIGEELEHPWQQPRQLEHPEQQPLLVVAWHDLQQLCVCAETGR